MSEESICKGYHQMDISKQTAALGVMDLKISNGSLTGYGEGGSGRSGFRARAEILGLTSRF